MSGQSLAHLRQRAAHQFVHRQPFTLELHAALLQARHGQQVVHQLLQRLCLIANLHQHVMRRPLRRMWQGRLGRAQNARQRRAQIMRDGREQGVAHALALHGDLGLLRHLHKMHTLQCQGNLAGTGFKQTALLGHPQLLRRTQLQYQHAARAHGRHQWHIKCRRSCQGIGSMAGHLAMLHAPATHAGVDLSFAARRQLQALIGIGHQQPGLGIKYA